MGKASCVVNSIDQCIVVDLARDNRVFITSSYAEYEALRLVTEVKRI